ncbi:MAG: hypothetical protein E4H28_02565 [Gemmatimonadales bacterium]|nr:MAG: hypothetical protein E4H28_02565 [Gemmatimonadales bacterium]
MRVSTLMAAAAGVLLLLPATADAQVRLGPQLSFGDDTDFGIGGRAIVNVQSLRHWDFIGTFDVFFPDDGPNNSLNYWEANGNMAYNFGVPETPSLAPYVGVGLNIAHISGDNPGGDFSDTDLGLNFFAGTQFEGRSVTPFAEIRVVAEGADQLVVTGGVLF